MSQRRPRTNERQPLEGEPLRLQAFLARTFAAVPVGTESEHLDLDGLIADLLNDVA